MQITGYVVSLYEDGKEAAPERQIADETAPVSSIPPI